MDRSQLKVNEVLENRKSLVSQNGKYSFNNQDDGNMVLYEKASNRPLWSSNTYRAPTGNLTLQANGDLVGKSWSTNTGGQGDETSVFIVQDDGNAVILSNGKKIWQTGTSETSRIHDEKKPLEAGQSLAGGEALVSPNGRFRLIMQEDVNLCLYDTSSENAVLWTTATWGLHPKLTLGPDGNLTVFSMTFVQWQSGTAGKGDSLSTLVVQDDGDAVIRSRDSVIWSTGTKVTAPANPDRLLAGESLRPGQFLQSPNGVYKLLMESDGRLSLRIVKDDNSEIWNVKTTSYDGVYRATLRRDGNFVLYDGLKDHWSSETASKGDANSVLLVLNDGNVVIRSKDTQIWESGTRQKSENLDRMVAGEDLGRGQSIYSPNGRYRFTFQNDGNAVLYDMKDGNKCDLWATGTDTDERGKLSLQNDGNLVVYGPHKAEWSSETHGKGDGSSVLRIQDDGDLVLTSKNVKIWSTGTAYRDKTDYLNAGESLRSDEALVSTNKQFKLVMQGDGNLVVYDLSGPDPREIWSPGSHGSYGLRATLEEGGNFVVYTNGDCRWTSETRDCGSNLVVTMRNDGNVVLTAGGVYVWSTKTGRRQ